MTIILQDDFSTDTNWGFATSGGTVEVHADNYLYVHTPKKSSSGASARVAEAVDTLAPRSEFDATFTYGTEADYVTPSGVAGYLAFLLISDAAEAAATSSGSVTDGLYIRTKPNGSWSGSGELYFNDTLIGDVSPIVGDLSLTGLIHKYRVQVAEGRVKTKGWLAADPEPEEWEYDLDISDYAVGSGNFGFKAVNNRYITSGTYNNRLQIDDLTISAVAPSVVSDTVDLDTPTATFDAYESEVVIPTPVRMDVDTATATLNANEVEIETQAFPSLSVVASRDQSTGADTSQYYLTVNDSSEAAIDFDIPAPVHNNNWVSASLQVSILGTANAVGDVVVRQIVAEWEDGVYTYTLSDDSITAALPFTGAATIDVSSLIDLENFYGLHISADGFRGYIHSSDSSGTTNHPRLTVTYDPSIEPPVLIDVDTPIITADSYDVSVETTTGVTFDVDTPTVSAEAYDAAGFGITEINLSSASVSLNTTEPNIEAYTVFTTVLTPSADYSINNIGQIQPAPDSNSLVAGWWNTSQRVAIVEFDLPEDVKKGELIGATFNYELGVARSGTMGWDVLDNITNDRFDFNSTPAASVGPVKLGATSYSVPLTEVIDLAEFKALRGSYPYHGSEWAVVRSSESANPPTLTLVWKPAPNTTVDVQTPTTSLVASDSTVSTTTSTGIILESVGATVDAHDVEVGIGTDYVGETAGMTLEAHDPEVGAVISPDVISDLETPTAYLIAPEASAGGGTNVDVDGTEAVVLDAHDVSVEFRIGAKVDVGTPRIRTNIIGVTDVNGVPVLPDEMDDPYFRTVLDTLRRPATSTEMHDIEWYRFDEGPNAVEAIDRGFWQSPNSGPQGQRNIPLYNVVTGLKNGPNGRHNFHYNGDAYSVDSSNPGRWDAPTSLEFTFRTMRETQFLFGGQGLYGVISVSPRAPWEVWLTNGYLEVRNYAWDGKSYSSQGLGNTYLADGKWHHVVYQRSPLGVTNWEGSQMRWGRELWVDAKLELRRRTGEGPEGRPLFIGGRTGYREAHGVALPKDNWFLGDMTEVVYRNGRALAPHEVGILRDDVMGIDSMRPETPTVDLRANEANVGGNRPRLLVLNFGETTAVGAFPGRADGRSVRFYADEKGRNVIDKLSYFNNEEAWIDFPGWGGKYINMSSHDSGNFLWTEVSVRDERRRDPVTDNYRLIDIDTDIDMSEYDIISIIGYPRTDWMWSGYDSLDRRNHQPAIPMRTQVEGVLDQVKDQVVSNGKSLYIADPFSAIALGIIDKVDYVPNFVERAWLDGRIGAQAGMLDVHSAVIDPFRGGNELAVADPANRSGWINRGARYQDFNANQKQRVRSAVPGLTDQPGWILKDMLRWYSVNPLDRESEFWSYAYEDRPDGPVIGEEFFMKGVEYDGLQGAYSRHYARLNGTVATPMDNVKVGVAVTTFGESFYATTKDHPDALIDNPYKNHAISIAARPGDLWDGKSISGKVYVNFTEAFGQNPESLDTGGVVEPGSIQIGDRFHQRTGGTITVESKHLKWNWSHYWGDSKGHLITIPATNSSGGNWGWEAGGSRESGSSGVSQNMSGAAAYSWFRGWTPARPIVGISVPSFAHRAVKWLAGHIDNSGNAGVNVLSARVTARAVEPSTSITGNTVVDLSTARINVESHTDANTVAPDVTVVLTTPSVRFRAGSMDEVVELSTARMTTDAYTTESVTDVDYSNALVMVLPRQIETLILEEA